MLALCLALVGSFANMTFLGVVIANTIIGTVQQLRSKRTVDQLTLVAAHKVHCRGRDGKAFCCPAKSWCGMTLWSLPPASRSVQTPLCAPAALRRTELITGEAEPVPKNVGDVLRSGSFLVSGRCTVRLTHVGAESYASKLATEAREAATRLPRAR